MGHSEEEVRKRKEEFERIRARAMMSEKFLRDQSDIELKRLTYLGVITQHKFREMMERRHGSQLNQNSQTEDNTKRTGSLGVHSSRDNTKRSRNASVMRYKSVDHSTTEKN